MGKVPVQKGKIEADQRTMKHQTRAQIDLQDAVYDRMRFDGQTLKFHTPKQK